jgi:Ca-activated chloride channel family protein
MRGRSHLVLALVLASCSVGYETVSLGPADGAPAPAPAPVDTGVAGAPSPVASGTAPTAPSPRAAAPRGEARRVAPPAQEKVAPALSFGGSTWLSNDDSMSLASAQRMLWALQHDQPLTPGQIRPHELLNYFTFETATPGQADVFTLTASAEPHGDGLALALALQGATPPAPPLDLIVVVDRSGSMKAEDRMGYTKRALLQLGDQLRPGDTVSLVAFSNHARTLLAHHPVGSDGTAAFAEAVRSLRPGGGTNLDAGLQRAWSLADQLADPRGRNQRVMLFTDANANQGRVDPHTLAEVGRRFEESGLRLTGVGVGTDYNDEVLDRLTERGKGAAVYLGSDAVVDRFFSEGFPALVQTLAHDVRFRLHLPDSLALERFHGEESSTRKADVQSTNFFAGTSQVFLQELAIGDEGLQPDDVLAVDVTWRDAATGEPEARRFDVTVAAALEASPYNVRKALVLTAFADVLSIEAMGGDCGPALEKFRRWTPLLDDPEITYVDGLLDGRCPPTGAVSTGSADASPSTLHAIDLRAIPGMLHLEVRSRDLVWRQRYRPPSGIALVDAPHGQYDLIVRTGEGTLRSPATTLSGVTIACQAAGGTAMRCR